jgi:hypothetical protein
MFEALRDIRRRLCTIFPFGLTLDSYQIFAFNFGDEQIGFFAFNDAPVICVLRIFDWNQNRALIMRRPMCYTNLSPYLRTTQGHLAALL